MGNPTRRGLLVATGAGTAAVVVAPASAAEAAPAHHASGPLVVYISDVSRPRLSLLVGEREVVVRDRDLVARLVHAARIAARD